MQAKYSLRDSEMWHSMGLEVSGTFLPSECPLVSHIILSFQKHHSPAMTSIPESQPLSDAIKILRPLNDVKSDQINYHQIIKVFAANKATKEVKLVKPANTLDFDIKIKTKQKPLLEINLFYAALRQIFIVSKVQSRDAESSYIIK